MGIIATFSQWCPFGDAYRSVIIGFDVIAFRAPCIFVFLFYLMKFCSRMCGCTFRVHMCICINVTTFRSCKYSPTSRRCLVQVLKVLIWSCASVGFWTIRPPQTVRPPQTMPQWRDVPRTKSTTGNERTHPTIDLYIHGRLPNYTTRHANNTQLHHHTPSKHNMRI